MSMYMLYVLVYVRMGGVSRMGDSYSAALDPGESKDPRAEMRWRGGETAALQRVQQHLGPH